MIKFVQVIEDKSLVTKYGAHLAEHFKAVNDYKTAERLYMECGMHKEAIQLHLETGRVNITITIIKDANVNQYDAIHRD